MKPESPIVLMQKLESEIENAERRIRAEIRTTYLEFSPSLSESLQAEIYLKLENLQTTGSFKFRGAMNKILALDPARAGQGVLVASTGNHGLATAEALKRAGYPGTVYVPPTISPAKLQALRRYPVEVVLFGQDPIDCELEARRLSRQLDREYVSPYNDLHVVAGQGTLGVELLRQLPDLDLVFIAVGGGGLISGTAAAIRRTRPGVDIVGCLPERSPAMYECVKAGRVIDVPTYDTLSDGTAGGVEPGAITLPLCQTLVDEYLLVPEEEILDGMRRILDDHHLVVEGSAAVSLAGARRMSDRIRGKKVVLVMCGGNVSHKTLQKVVC